MFAFTAVVFLLVRPEPGPISVSVEDRARATELVRQLGSDSFIDRDQAHKDLWSMGRHAIIALKTAANADPDPEVRRRCELLLPRANALDFEARLAAFLADTDGKFEHSLPGWDKFRGLTANELLAREFFVEMLRSDGNRHLLAGFARDKGELAQRVIDRKQELYQKMYPRPVAGMSSSMERYEPTPYDAATILFCDAVLGDSGAAIVVGVRVATPATLFARVKVRAALDSDQQGPVMKKLLVGWLDTRTSPAGLYQGLTLLNNFNMKDGAKYAAKLLAMENAPSLYRATAATTIAKVGEKDDAKYLVPLMNDTTAVRNVVGGNNEIQLRDVALAMASHLTGHGPEILGMRNQNGGEYAKYYYWNYSFYSAEDREKGFAKWAELEPKLKPPEEKKLPVEEPKK